MIVDAKRWNGSVLLIVFLVTLVPGRHNCSFHPNPKPMIYHFFFFLFVVFGPWVHCYIRDPSWHVPCLECRDRLKPNQCAALRVTGGRWMAHRRQRHWRLHWQVWQLKPLKIAFFTLDRPLGDIWCFNLFLFAMAKIRKIGHDHQSHFFSSSSCSSRRFKRGMRQKQAITC